MPLCPNDMRYTKLISSYAKGKVLQEENGQFKSHLGVHASMSTSPLLRSILPGLETMVLSIALAAVLLLLVYAAKFRRKTQLPLPPGPKGLPFIGSYLSIPKNAEWITYHKWCKDFNTDILHVNFAGTPLIILDSYEAVNELLDKRSATFSDRPQYTMQSELMGLDFNFAFMRYGQQKLRRLMHQHFHAGASSMLRPHSLKASRNLLYRFLDNPHDVIANLRHMAGETIMALAYGLQVQKYDDPFISTAEKAVYTLLNAASPGKYLVDTFPVLKYVPEWVPGAGFKKKAKECRKLARDMLVLPYIAAKRNIVSGLSSILSNIEFPQLIGVCSPLPKANGHPGGCFTSKCLERLENAGGTAYFSEDTIQCDAGTMYTVSAIGSCILGLLENPHVVRRAQEELDKVVKPGQLPNFEDQSSLPYITAIAKESLRWRDVVPIGRFLPLQLSDFTSDELLAVPRKLLAKEEYKGYRLPAGSIVIPNAWAILHNEETYPEPFKFNPDRFMTAEGNLDDAIFDPERACWGFGRRICPGRHLALDAIWINIASILSVFNVEKAIDGAGNVESTSTGTNSSQSRKNSVPKPYKCSITPRSKEARELIRASATWESLDEEP
ncbi:LOW QUALITY PROTEIN: hypothetical protein CVT26_013072 [Gymnopilus dilepis]|uniref:Cytochrome P450 n=1 Tax=Gymnopilus dilepis TaxID=231916 RepID=A0A409WD53_9AGAR|nr:LOW QUALITY PROTEIN: hypothetical protein CVT26_013072 [Gymnopilus dilepis]